MQVPQRRGEALQPRPSFRRASGRAAEDMPELSSRRAEALRGVGRAEAAGGGAAQTHIAPDAGVGDAAPCGARRERHAEDRQPPLPLPARRKAIEQSPCSPSPDLFEIDHVVPYGPGGKPGDRFYRPRLQQRAEIFRFGAGLIAPLRPARRMATKSDRGESPPRAARPAPAARAAERDDQGCPGQRQAAIGRPGFRSAVVLKPDDAGAAQRLAAADEQGRIGGWLATAILYNTLACTRLHLASDGPRIGRPTAMVSNMPRPRTVSKLILPLLMMVAVGSVPAAGQPPAQAEPIDRAGWLRDLEQLKQALAEQYANLDWMVEQRGLDLPGLADEAARRIGEAQNESQARRAMVDFLQSFGDGHLAIRWEPRAAQGPAAAGAQPQAPVPLCESQGFREQRLEPGLDLTPLDGFRTLTNPASRYFPAGILTLGAGRRIGVLRIALFDQHPYPELCREAAGQLGISQQGLCAEGCAGPLEREAANLLTRRLEEQIEALRREGATELLVDLTGNGGGNNWVGVAARTLTRVRLREPRQGFIRHPHWTAQFENQIALIRQDRETASPRYRPLLDRASERFARALQAARQPCPRHGLWRGEEPGCTLVSFDGPLFSSGVFDYLPPGGRPEGLTCCYLFAPQRFTYREGVWSGRLRVAVDRETASAAEYFAALLADNRAATIVGEPTYGAGCGYTNGGIRTRLAHSGGMVVMPDCVRLRADGRNEVDGIAPDIAVPWRRSDNALQRARRLQETLRRTPLP